MSGIERTTYYASGLIESDGRFNITYGVGGVAEPRVRIRGDANCTPLNGAVFWANGQSRPTDGEDDILKS